MTNLRLLMAVSAIGGVLAMPAMAQQAPPPGAPGVVATTNNPNLAVATVKLENGTRTSKIVGTAVYTDANEKVGTVDDLILTEGDKVTVAIVSIGGVLGLGSKLVAVPFGELKREPDKVTLTGVSKDALNAMPSFVY